MLSIFFIGLALSMDAFSLSVSVGTININNKQKTTLVIAIAIMHFIMPQIGIIFGNYLFEIIPVNVTFFNIVIFVYLGINMLLKKGENKQRPLSIINCFILAFCVSIDSFSVGLGLSAITSYEIISALIFALTSGIMSYLGLILGTKAFRIMNEKATVLGAILLFCLAIVNLIKELFDFG